MEANFDFVWLGVRALLRAAASRVFLERLGQPVRVSLGHGEEPWRVVGYVGGLVYAYFDLWDPLNTLVLVSGVLLPLGLHLVCVLEYLPL